MPSTTRRSARRDTAFFGALEKTGSPAAAARAAGYPRSTVYRRRSLTRQEIDTTGRRIRNIVDASFEAFKPSVNRQNLNLNALSWRQRRQHPAGWTPSCFSVRINHLLRGVDLYVNRR